MDLYCVMGHPVEHSRSPWIHARFAALTGQTLSYGRRLAPLDAFAQTLDTFRAEPGARGCNVTVPFKFDALRIAHYVSPRAALAQAANVLSFDSNGIHADNSDGVGLVRDVTRHAGVALDGADVLLLGGGGAAAGVLGPLLEAGTRRVVVANRTPAKALALARRHALLACERHASVETQPLSAITGSYNLVINATASSLAGVAMPLAGSVLKRGALAIDLMYGPPAVGFLTWARDHDAVARDGLGMLVEQAAEAFEIWRGVRPPTAGVLAELRRSMG